jgi:hypothetical protein
VNPWVAVAVVAAASFGFRAVPLVIGAGLRADGATARSATAAGFAAVAAVVAGAVRPFVDTDPATGLGAIAAVALAVGLTWRGRPFLVAVTAGLALDLLVTAVA